MLETHIVPSAKSTLSVYGLYRKLISYLLFLILMLCISRPLNANNIQDHNLKAVYLFRFTLLTNWGEFKPQDNQYVFCSQAPSEITDTLRTLIKKQPNYGTVVSFRSIKKLTSPSCHLIYTTTQQPKLLAQLKARYPHALLIGEGAAFIHAGGSIAFIKENNRIKPLISLNNLAPTGLSLRSQLLSVSDLADNKEVS
ncbi:YfiR family protein [uncultured Aliivibrio sp.]|uniref:YfiR family protein n=1 Tax=Aliivibrio salmonicida TaxID=40269 RepID=UPI002605611E|nr:YfiR family protein [uncultured Aliivibrio sp.]